MAVATYRFFPWVRSGLAAVLPERAPVGRRAIADLTLSITPELAHNRKIELLGPGDAAGIDTRFIIRTDPRPNAIAVEPNYLASIEFDRPDFPWLLTPRGAGDSLKLEPWLVLVVLDRDRVGDPQVGGNNPLPTITLDEAAIKEELPDLAESWAWAHAQRVATNATDDADALKDEPDANVSRLLCPRRLVPNRRWIACLVPAYDIGIAAARGLPAASTGAPKPAWTKDSEEIVLPLYYHWTFETGPDGDFEKLASRLKPFKAVAGELTPEVERRARGYLGAADGTEALVAALPPTDPANSLRFDAVLETFGRDMGTPAEVPAAIAEALAAATAPSANPDETEIGPPLNGGRIVGRSAADPAQIADRWFDELNLDPRTRVAARIGADAVRAFQEELMDATWDQVGDVIEANAQLDRSRFAAAIAERVFERHVVKLAPERQLAFFSPLYARTRMGDGSVRALIRRTSLPDRAFDAALRRLASPNSSLSRSTARFATATPTPTSSAATPFLGLTALLQRDVEQVDPGEQDRDGIAALRLAHLLLERDGSGATITMPPGDMIKASALAEPIAIRPLTIRADLADGVLSDRNRFEILALASASGVAPKTIEAAARKAASRANRDAIVVVHRAGTKIEADVIERSDSGEVSLIGAAGRKALFTIEGHQDADPLTLARLAFKLPPTASAGRDLTVMLHREGGGLKASFAEVSLGNLRGGTAAQRKKKRLQAIRDAHNAAGGQLEEVDIDNPVLGTLSAPLHGAAAAEAVRGALETVIGTVPALTKPKLIPFDLGTDVQSPLTAIGHAISPASSFRNRLQAMVVVPGRLPNGLDAFDPVRAAPDFQVALATLLSTSGPEAFVPRDIELPAESISALQTNPRWEAAAMVGANHEINAELIWRTYPTDGRGTSLQRFWPWLQPDRNDIEAIASWNSPGSLSSKLGGGKSNVVIAIRGELLRRYPNTLIFAWKADGPETLRRITDTTPRSDVIRDAQFRQSVAPDLTLAGFDLTKEQFREGWFLILQEPISESRFGLDEVGTPVDRGLSINGRNWGEPGAPAPGGHLTPDFLQASATSAIIANTLLQRPVRVAIHSDNLTLALEE